MWSIVIAGRFCFDNRPQGNPSVLPCPAFHFVAERVLKCNVSAGQPSAGKNGAKRSHHNLVIGPTFLHSRDMILVESDCVANHSGKTEEALARGFVNHVSRVRRLARAVRSLLGQVPVRGIVSAPICELRAQGPVKKFQVRPDYFCSLRSGANHQVRRAGQWEERLVGKVAASAACGE